MSGLNDDGVGGKTVMARGSGVTGTTGSGWWVRSNEDCGSITEVSFWTVSAGCSSIIVGDCGRMLSDLLLL